MQIGYIYCISFIVLNISCCSSVLLQKTLNILVRNTYFITHLFIRLKNKAVMYIFIVHLFLYHKMKCVILSLCFQIDYFEKWNLPVHSVSNTLRKNVSYFNAHLYIRLKNKAVMFIFIVNLFLYHKMKCVIPVFSNRLFNWKMEFARTVSLEYFKEECFIVAIYFSYSRTRTRTPKKPRHRVTAGVAR